MEGLEIGSCEDTRRDRVAHNGVAPNYNGFIGDMHRVIIYDIYMNIKHHGNLT